MTRRADVLDPTGHRGHVEVGRLNGPAQITTNRGAIRTTEAGAGAVVLHTHMGDITARSL